MSESIYWRVTFKLDGSVRGVTRLRGPGHPRWVVVQAPTSEAARAKGYALYCARKKRERVAALKAEGRCACGRELDGAIIDVGARKGEKHTACATCRERRVGWRKNHQERVAAGTVGQGVVERDEGARVALNLQRQRDRRGEIRLETLLECRKAWERAPRVGAYRDWLRAEIDKLTKPQAAA